MKFANLARGTALLLAALMLAGCHKGDGTEVYPAETVPVAEDSRVEELEKQFTNVTVDENAKSDYPFSFAPAAQPKQEIVLVMIYDNTDQQGTHTQAINYYDRDGNVYRYRHPLQIEGDWIKTLYADYDRGATVVNIMGEAEKQTLWYLAANADRYRSAELQTENAGEVLGIKWLYLVDPAGEPVLLARYDDTSVWCGDSEVVSFLNWFRYFYHGSFTFGG